MDNINIKVDINYPKEMRFCPYCFGTGKLKAMQNAMTYEGISIRVQDTFVKCSHCNGTGVLIK
jgi:DnaJ-class molecular chaperone